MVAGVSKTTVPKLEGGGGGEECLSLRRATEGVERTGAIASKNHSHGTKVLHRKTEGIKFNRRDDLVLTRVHVHPSVAQRLSALVKTV